MISRSKIVLMVGKTLFFVASILIASGVIYAQEERSISPFLKNTIEKADIYFLQEDYYKALLNYEKVFVKNANDTTIALKIAECYMKLNDYIESELWYSKILDESDGRFADAHHIFNYAQILTINGNYPKAKEWYTNYYFIDNSDKRGLAGITTIENFNKLYRDTTFYSIYPSAINSPYSDFNAVQYNNGIIFISNRDKAVVSKMDKGNNPGFSKWYFAEFDNDNYTGKCREIGKDFNISTKFNTGPFVFYDNFQKIIFSQNTPSEQLKTETTVTHPIQLFFAQRDNLGEWEEASKLEFCQNNYSYGHPAITPDGKKLIFSSDMPGGYGGSDLYVSYFENGNWQEPQNLGPYINTRGNEMFPYLKNDSVLYFSSDGHGGLGGLDICYVSWQKPENPDRFGIPINSSGDDFGIIYSNDGMSGHFSSNRKGTIGSDDIYSFRVICISIIVQIIDQNTSVPISNANVVSISGDKENLVGKTDSVGNIEIIIPVDTEIEIKVKKSDFESQLFTIEPEQPETKNAIVFHAENTIRVDEKQNENIEKQIYKVQVAASLVPLTKEKLHKRYKGSMEVTMNHEDGWYKYTIGEFETYKEACECLNQCDVYDAFVPVYLNKKRIKILLPKIIKK